MKLSLSLATACVAAGFAFLPVQSLHAQAQATPALEGVAVPGVCMLSREAVITQSKVGQAAAERLKQLATQQQTQLEAQRTPLDNDVKAFQQKAPQLSEADRQAQGAALQQRMQAFQQQVQDLNQRVELTRGKVMQQIGDQAQPLVVNVYGQHRCGLLLNRDAVLGGNTTHDLTAEVVAALDKKLTSLNFNLEPLPQN